MYKLIILFFVPASLFSQILSRVEADNFVKDLLWHEEKLNSWFDENNLEASHRLGIQYDGVKYKNLIGYEIVDAVKEAVRNGRLGYAIRLDTLGKEYTRLILSIDDVNTPREFYFRGNRCISPLAYFARNWAITDSKHFRFIISDSSCFNTYCIEKLETFLEQTAVLIGLSDADMRGLQKGKIYYYLCRDENEIERLTGFRARGMCNLAYDAVISTFSNHYHELLHLLINYRLRHLPLYTHPFLQEGFAVAYGGRGGMECNVLMNLGEFLWRSQFVDFQSLLSKTEFEQLDASLSYPAAGLYNRFLIETAGIERYLRLYRKHSGAAGDRSVSRIALDELPPHSAWQAYLHDHMQDAAITLDSASSDAQVIFKDESASIYADNTRYYFSLSDSLFLPGSIVSPGYMSKVFRERFPGSTYRNEKYLISANAEEISVYNLFTNNLIANYATSFSIPPKNVPQRENTCCFSIRKKVFDVPIEVLLERTGRPNNLRKRER
jgi:hypothetical protein